MLFTQTSKSVNSVTLPRRTMDIKVNNKVSVIIDNLQRKNPIADIDDYSLFVKDSQPPLQLAKTKNIADYNLPQKV